MIIKSLLLVPDQSIYHLMEKVKMEGGLMTPPPPRCQECENSEKI